MTDELIDDEFTEGPDEMPIEEEIEEVRFWLQRGVEQMQLAMDDFKAYWRGGLGEVVVSSVVVSRPVTIKSMASSSVENYT